MRLLLPDRGEVDVATAYPAPLGRHDDRPWVMLCMVSSIDGSTVVDGRSGALSNPTDGAVLSRLRAIADVVLVGSGTASGEGYGPPKKPGQRIGVVTRSGSIDPAAELFTSGAGFVITTERTELDDADGSIDVLRCGDDEVDLRAAVRRLPEVCPGASVVQAEGGPTLNGALADADLIDELDLSTSPGIVGGDGPRLVTGAADRTDRYTLEQLAIEDSFVFTRWLRRRST